MCLYSAQLRFLVELKKQSGSTLKDYEIAVILRMYDEGLIGGGYRSLEAVRKEIRWKDIERKYKVKGGFEEVARRLIKRKLLSDDGKSMAVVSLDRLGVAFARAYLKTNPRAMDDLDALR